jgi:protein-tyrosine-phosphatase
MMISRRVVAFSGFIAPLTTTAWAKPCAVARVLFVCPAGTVKSAIAREELRRVAKMRGISVVAESRGIHPENHISPLLAQRLKQDGIDPLADPLRTFTPEEAGHADIVVAFDDAAAAPGLEKARKWQVAAWNTQYDDAKSDTLENIDRLVHELSLRSC